MTREWSVAASKMEDDFYDSEFPAAFQGVNGEWHNRYPENGRAGVIITEEWAEELLDEQRERGVL